MSALALETVLLPCSICSALAALAAAALAVAMCYAGTSPSGFGPSSGSGCLYFHTRSINCYSQVLLCSEKRYLNTVAAPHQSQIFQLVYLLYYRLYEH